MSRSFALAPPSTRSSVNSTLASIAMAFGYFGHLPRDAVERGAGDVGLGRSPRHTDQQGARVRIPMGCAESRKCRYQHDTATVIDFTGQ